VEGTIPAPAVRESKTGAAMGNSQDNARFDFGDIQLFLMLRKPPVLLCNCGSSPIRSAVSVMILRMELWDAGPDFILHRVTHMIHVNSKGCSISGYSNLNVIREFDCSFEN
jgi:hypothetical protein